MAKDAMTQKVLVLGIDGMDPQLTKKFLGEGLMPNVEKMLARGAAREDLYMLGGVPTITPPMWTTLSTGAYPMTHGVTCYFNTDGVNLGTMVNNFNSAQVKAEQIWEVTAKAGKKTLVWTWPCSWPPVIDNENLHVVGGTAPTGPNAGYVTVDGEHLIYASTEFDQVKSMAKEELKGGVGCVITDDMREAAAEAEEKVKEIDMPDAGACWNSATLDAWPCFSEEEGEGITEWEYVLNRYESPIKEPKNWANELPEGARELTLVASQGLIRFPALLLKNEEGVYDRVAVYNSKKDAEPFVTVKDGEFHPVVVCDAMVNDHKLQVQVEQ